MDWSNRRCIISGCCPNITYYLGALIKEVTAENSNAACALQELARTEANASQDDLSVIGPIHPSGQPYALSMEDRFPELVGRGELDDLYPEDGPSAEELSPEVDIRVVPQCVTGESWESGYVETDPWIKHSWIYLVSSGTCIFVQTFALDIMILATQGRMTPLRLWCLAMHQKFESEPRPDCLKGVDYGKMGEYLEVDGDDDEDKGKHLDPCPGMTRRGWAQLKDIQDVRVVKQQIVHKGNFWVWMTPDCFPVSPTDYDPPAPTLYEAHSTGNFGAFETLPLEILSSIASFLPFDSIVNLASTCRSLRTDIFANDHLARTWIRTSTPWWIPVPPQTPRIQDEYVTSISPYLASQVGPSNQSVQVNLDAAGLDWAYIRRCARSGSMRNRQRIWHTALDIERIADLSGM